MQKTNIQTTDISIREEIRNIVRQEVKLAMKQRTAVQTNASKQEKYSTLKISSLNNLQSQVQSKLNELKSKNPSLANQEIRIMLEIDPNNSVQQAKPVQKSIQQQKPVQAKPVQNNSQQNVVRITSVQQLAQHLQKAITAQLVQRKEIANAVSKTIQVRPQIQNQPIKILKSEAIKNNNPSLISSETFFRGESKPTQQQKQNSPQKVQVKITPKAIQPQQKLAQNQPALKVGLNPGNKRGESKNNPVLQQQANDILSKMALAKKQQQNNQKK